MPCATCETTSKTCSAHWSRETRPPPPDAPTDLTDPAPPSQGRLTALVGFGILLTRLLGFVRERLFAHFLGDGPAADAFRAALRIPNVIRNLLGEGTLSASFIPVYAGMIARGETEAARRLSSAIASLLVLLAAAAALVGVMLAPLITDFAAPGFSAERRILTIRLVEILFPMSGLLILSAWCLGVLNTHRRFFLSYAAPSLWNVAQIATLVVLGGVLLDVRLSVALAWGALIGAGFQLIVQLPATLRLTTGVRWLPSLSVAGVPQVARAWLPVVIGAGVYQISSVIDTQLASLLPQGAVAILGYAQLLAILPVSLFGVSVAAVALPELSREADSGIALLRERLQDSGQRLAFFVLPAAFALAALAPELIAALFQTGAFGASETQVAAAVLAAYAIAVPAQATVKLFASGHYAFGDTRTPVRIAVISVATSAGSAYWLMQYFGPAGIALGAAIGAYVNSGLNLWRLERRVGRLIDLPGARGIIVVAAASVAATGVAMPLSWVLREAHVWGRAGAGLAVFGLVFGGLTAALGHPESRRLLRRIGARKRT